MPADDAAIPLTIGSADEEAEESLQGKPRTMRLEKAEYPPGQQAVSLVIVADYDTRGRVVERRVYRPDGTLSFHEAFQYEADPRVHTTRILDAQGAMVSTRKVLTRPDGEESNGFQRVGRNV